MSSHQSTGKARVIKTLAVAGFIGIIIAIAWLSMQLVHVVPGAFASLASLAEGVRQYQGAVPNNQPSTTESSTDVQSEIQPINLAADERTVTSGKATTIRWSTTDTPGSYVFRYTCTEGVAVDLEGVAGLTSIACDTNYNLGNVDSVSIRPDSEKERFAELTYEIAFLRTNDTEPVARGTQTVAIVNDTLVEFNDISTTSPVATVVTPRVPTNGSAPVTTQPAYTQEYIYAIPTSDPNGTTDLTVRFLGVGTIVNNTFITTPLTRTMLGAVQFEVKNIGTKTSSPWTYRASLPGQTCTSTSQIALKPNERSIITLGFPATEAQSHRFSVTVTDPSDRSVTNNRFSQIVTIN